MFNNFVFPKIVPFVK